MVTLSDLFLKKAMSPQETPSTILDVPLKDLDTGYERFRFVRPKEYRLMRESIERNGQMSPAVAVLKEENKGYLLIDGFKRYQALSALGRPTLRARTLQGESHVIKAAIVDLNRSQGTLHAFEEALIVRSLHRDDCLGQAPIGILLGRHKSWVCRRIALCEQLCEEAVSNIRLGLLGFATARALWRLPRGNQPPALECILKYRLSSRETELLVSQLLQTPAHAHSALLHQPLDILDLRCPPRPEDIGKTDSDCRRLCASLKMVWARIEPVRNRTQRHTGEQFDSMVKTIDDTLEKLVQLKTLLQGDGRVD
jgi:ParB-like chromosome segregation protein Spo0J